MNQALMTEQERERPEASIVNEARLHCLTCEEAIPAGWAVGFVWKVDGTFKGVKHLYDCVYWNQGQKVTLEGLRARLQSLLGELHLAGNPQRWAIARQIESMTEVVERGVCPTCHSQDQGYVWPRLLDEVDYTCNDPYHTWRSELV
jgi:hypothetical protein